ncbi:hypothetical protein J2T14_000032 [Paenibacillus harenae]|nr:hypothetical protein [Paenibacillus harenae]
MLWLMVNFAMTILFPIFWGDCRLACEPSLSGAYERQVFPFAVVAHLDGNKWTGLFRQSDGGCSPGGVRVVRRR